MVYTNVTTSSKILCNAMMIVSHCNPDKRNLISYLRPSLAFGYCRCLHMSMCLYVRACVCQPRVHPRHNSSPFQARITKFGSEVQNTLVKIPIVSQDGLPWPSRLSLTSKSKFVLFWDCPHHNSSPIQARVTKFRPEVQNTAKIFSVLGVSWPWHSWSWLFQSQPSARILI